MVRGRKRQKTKDKWRLKKWLIVKAPLPFGGDSVAYIPVTSNDKAIGRVVGTTLFDILKQDPQHYSIKLYFQIESVEGDIAHTIMKGHEYSREYLRSMVRRGSSSIRLIKNFTTRDQAVVQAQMIVFTVGQLNTSRKHAIRSITDEVVKRKATELTYNQFAQEAVIGKIASDVYNAAKKISRLRHVGVSKTKLIKKPSIEVEDIVTLKPTSETVEDVDVPVTSIPSN
jgi:small subunit ribosomal protein S3Ae|tara:strand:- start:92 stop:772 length:681 start_codon:yes stop_codon:yes gene_type:complete